MVMTEIERKYYEIKKLLLDIRKENPTKYDEWEHGYHACAKDVLNKMNPKSDWKPCGEKK